MTRAIFHRVSALGFGWNERQLTEEHFYKLCRKFKITVNRLPLKVRGYYTKVNGVDHITLSSNLNSFQELFVMWHEMGHFLMHAPAMARQAKFSGHCEDDREEKEADAFAYCSILPISDLSNIPIEVLAEEHCFSPRFLMERLKVHDEYGI